MKCRATKRRLEKDGVIVTEVMLDDYPDKIELMRKRGWEALPLVELTAPDGEVSSWHDMSMEHLEGVRH